MTSERMRAWAEALRDESAEGKDFELAAKSGLEIAAALERAAEQDEWLTVAKQSYTCPFCNEVYGPRKISTEDLREAVRLHAPTCDKHPLTQRIASLEAQLSDRDDTIASMDAKIDEAHAALNKAGIKDSVGGGHLIARIRDAGRRIASLEAQLAAAQERVEYLERELKRGPKLGRVMQQTVVGLEVLEVLSAGLGQSGLEVIVAARRAEGALR